MPGGNSARILKVYSNDRVISDHADRDRGPVSTCTLAPPDFQRDLDQAFVLLEEIREIFETRQTYVLHTLMDLVAIEIKLLQKEQGGQYYHSARDIAEAFSGRRT